MNGLKMKFWWIAVLIIGGVIGWVISYLRLPMIHTSGQIWVGFFLAVAIVSLLIIAKGMFGTSSSQTRAKLPWLVSLGGSVAIIILLLIWSQNANILEAYSNQNTQLERQAALLEANRISGISELLATTIASAEQELEKRNDGTLSEAMLKRIAAMSVALRPYRFLEGDSLVSKPLSPERGSLLIALTYLEFDSTTWSEIKALTTFEYADLQSADLTGVDYSGIDLSKARLTDAILDRANLDRADLSHSESWGASFNDASLVHASFENANLGWASMNNVRAVQCMFNGANMVGAKMRNANLTRAQFQWSGISQATLVEATARKTNFKGAEASNANFSDANLSKANLSRTVLNGANFSNTNCDSAGVKSELWMQSISDWHMEGASQIQSRYELIEDTSGSFKHVLIASDSL